ncbi:hypothetical protein J6590_099536 [Homalodisca vitripennis]|nr:hypothetical protein J6590_099536 [Homalodisca vitripennis]
MTFYRVQPVLRNVNRTAEKRKRLKNIYYRSLTVNTDKTADDCTALFGKQCYCKYNTSWYRLRMSRSDYIVTTVVVDTLYGAATPVARPSCELSHLSATHRASPTTNNVCAMFVNNQLSRQLLLYN